MATKLLKLEKRRRFGLKIEGKKKELWQPIKGEQMFCGNGVAENGRKKKKNCGNQVVEIVGEGI